MDWVFLFAPLNYVLHEALQVGKEVGQAVLEDIPHHLPQTKDVKEDMLFVLASFVGVVGAFLVIGAIIIGCS